MAIDDFLESEVAVAVAATAVALSPRARRLVRRGAVYGALKATDMVTAAARGVASGVSSQGERGEATDGRGEASAA